VWTQKDAAWLIDSIITRLKVVMKYYGITSAIQLLEGKTRFEVRVSSKKLYEIIRENLEKLPQLIFRDPNIAWSWISGMYDAEGDKTGKRIRLWCKNRTVLTLVKQFLESQGIEVSGPYLDDRRSEVYVLEIRSSSRQFFFKNVKLEHPKMKEF